NFGHFAALKLSDILGEVGFGSAPIEISNVNGLCPLNVPIVGCVSTFDINDISG
ncbi:unnamed protein product, partial [Rotaria sp. Silwood2]